MTANTDTSKRIKSIEIRKFHSYSTYEMLFWMSYQEAKEQNFRFSL